MVSIPYKYRPESVETVRNTECLFCQTILNYCIFTGVELYSQCIYCPFCKIQDGNLEDSKLEFWFHEETYVMCIISERFDDITVHSIFYPKKSWLDIFDNRNNSLYSEFFSGNYKEQFNLLYSCLGKYIKEYFLKTLEHSNFQEAHEKVFNQISNKNLYPQVREKILQSLIEDLT